MSEIQIKEGKWRRRDGIVSNIVLRGDNYEGPYPWIDTENLISVSCSGRYIADAVEHLYDIIEQIPDEPTQPEPAKADLVPGYSYIHNNGTIYYCIGKDVTGKMVVSNEVMGSNGRAYRSLTEANNPFFLEMLSPYTPPPKPRTWTFDVVVVEVIVNGEVTRFTREIGSSDDMHGYKELGRTTVTIKEKVKPCPTK